MELTPDLRSYYQKSLESLERGHFDYAIEMLRSVIVSAPRHTPSYQLLIKALRERDRVKSPSLPTKMVNSLRAEFFFWLARYAVFAGDVRAAERRFLRGLIYRIHHRRILSEWLKLARKEGSLDMAIVIAEAQTSEMPDREEAFLMLSKLYLEKGLVNEAKRTIQRGLENIPSSPHLIRRFKEIEAERTMKQTDWGDKK